MSRAVHCHSSASSASSVICLWKLDPTGIGLSVRIFTGRSLRRATAVPRVAQRKGVTSILHPTGPEAGVVTAALCVGGCGFQLHADTCLRCGARNVKIKRPSTTDIIVSNIIYRNVANFYQIQLLVTLQEVKQWKRSGRKAKVASVLA